MTYQEMIEGYNPIDEPLEEPEKRDPVEVKKATVTLVVEYDNGSTTIFEYPLVVGRDDFPFRFELNHPARPCYKVGETVPYIFERLSSFAALSIHGYVDNKCKE